MVDWKSPEVIAKNAVAFDRFIHALLGLYIWEWVVSFPFDWQFISGAKRFRWPMTIYFLNRYCLLFALVGISIALNVKTEIHCQALYTFNQCFGNAAIGLASINLSLRTIAVWSQKWYIVLPLVLMILGHWSLLLHGILLKAIFIPGTGCVIIETNSQVLAITFIYSMVFDFFVLCLTAFKILSPTNSRSKLVELIFSDGLIYFLIAFLANLVATVFMLVNLNPIMSIIANVPAAIASTIVACRVVRRLSNFTGQAPEMFPTTTGGSTIAFRTNTSAIRPSKFLSKGPEGVHVQMETFNESPTVRNSFVTFDTSANPAKAGSYDPETQSNGAEFKRPPPY